MIRLNLATKPGLLTAEDIEASDKAIERSLSPISRGEEVESAEEALTSAGGPAEKREPSEKVESSLEELAADKEKQSQVTESEIDTSTLKELEKNLEMMESAEQEDFVPRKRSEKKQAKLDELEELIEMKGDQHSATPGRLRRKSIFRYIGIFVLVVIVAIGGYWIYQNFKDKLPFGKKESPRQTRTEQTAPASQPTAKQITESVRERLPEVALMNEVSKRHIEQVQQGKQLLHPLVQILSFISANSKIQYLRADQQKLSFIFYLATRQQAVDLKNYLLNSDFPITRNIFYIEEHSTYPGTPYQVMAIFNYQIGTPQLKVGYRYLNDYALNHEIYSAGRQTNINIAPLRLYSRETASTREASVNALGNKQNMVRFLQQIEDLKINFGIKEILLKENQNKNAGTASLELVLSATIYPPKS